MKKNLNYWYDKLLSLLLSMLGVGGMLTLTGCPGPCAYGPEPTNHRVKVYPDKLYFDSDDDESQFIEVDTEARWHVDQVSKFISVTPTEGYSESIIKVKIEENSLEERRQGIIVIQSVEEPRYADTVIVVQEGMDDHI